MTPNTPNRKTSTRDDNRDSKNPQDRRNDVRLAGRGHVEAVVIDRYSQPIQVMRKTESLNVSAGGMLLASATPVEPGSRIKVNLDDTSASKNLARQAQLETLDCEPWQDNLYRLRCKVTAGQIPAELIYNW